MDSFSQAASMVILLQVMNFKELSIFSLFHNKQNCSMYVNSVFLFHLPFLHLLWCVWEEVGSTWRDTMNAIAELPTWTHNSTLGSESATPSCSILHASASGSRVYKNPACGVRPSYSSSGRLHGVTTDRNRLQILRAEEDRVSTRKVRRHGWRWDDEEVAAAGSQATFAEGVEFFNAGEYYECHDVMEGLWNDAPEPTRSIFHGILQCSVGIYHLLHQNHKGAMVELGEGLTKLRRVGFKGGPLHDFEREASALLEFIYNTQLEHAACADDICITMDGSEQSYQLLGNFGAGQPLYRLILDFDETGEPYIEFLPQRLRVSSLEMDFKPPPPVTVKVPLLQASEEDLYKLS